MNFSDKVTKASNDFYKLKGYNANEIFLGFLEEQELKDFVEENAFLVKIHDDELLLSKHEKKDEFRGMKVRYTEQESCFRVEYNPHYGTS